MTINKIYDEILSISLDVDKDLTVIINSSLDLSQAQKILDIPGVKFLIISDNDVDQKKYLVEEFFIEIIIIDLGCQKS